MIPIKRQTKRSISTEFQEQKMHDKTLSKIENNQGGLIFIGTSANFSKIFPLSMAMAVVGQRRQIALCCTTKAFGAPHYLDEENY